MSAQPIKALRFTGEVHPFADLFPMLPPDQLQELADDIKEHGLLNPLIVDGGGVLIDGRNRLAACGLAGVEPQFTRMDGDPFALIVSANAKRRQLTAGQRAMAVAYGMREQGLWDETANAWKRKRGDGGARKYANAKISPQDLTLAGAILAYSEPIAREVLAGKRSLRPAYDYVQDQRKEAADRERQHRDLQEQAPEILALVDDDFTMDMAYAAYLKRDEDRLAAERDIADVKKKYVTAIYGAVYSLSGHDASDERRAFLPQLDLTRTPEPVTPDLIDQAITVLQRIKGSLG